MRGRHFVDAARTSAYGKCTLRAPVLGSRRSVNRRREGGAQVGGPDAFNAVAARWDLVNVSARASTCGLTRATMTAEAHVPVIALTATEQAVAADQRRIAIGLVDPVIRDLFGVGLTLQSAVPLVGGPAQQRVNAAIDGIDRIIRTIRDVVFDLADSDGDRRGSG